MNQTQGDLFCRRVALAALAPCAAPVVARNASCGGRRVAGIDRAAWLAVDRDGCRRAVAVVVHEIN